LEKRENGRLISNPMKKVDKLKNPDEKYLVCFPSTVVELKHHQAKFDDEVKCYCQAANAASTALSMLSRAARFSIPNNSYGEIRPVIAFTFIGSCSKVWIAFVTGKYKECVKLKKNGKGGKIRRNICEYVSLLLTCKTALVREFSF
jgi:hypothetical protein